MSSRAEQLAVRRCRLMAESEALRTNIVLELEPLSHSLDAVDSGIRIFARLRQHPEWLAGAALAVVLVRPSRVSDWLRATVLGLRLWRQFAPVLRLTGRR